jgi:transcriptional regulator with XRE-family HTH domain
MVLRQKPRPRKTFLKEWREYRGLTQEQAAERLGWDQSTLSRIERGQVAYTQQLLEAASDAYQCEPADLLMRNPLADDAPWSIYDSLKRVDPETQARVKDAVQAFIRKTG